MSRQDAADRDFGLLQDVFADIASGMRSNPLEHLLVLTYEFDDQQLLNLLSGRQLSDLYELQINPLRYLAAMQPVVVYDARKTREFNQLPHFLDLLPVNVGAHRCHHAKAYLFITRNNVRLVLGSFNLTQTGLFANREVYTELLWSQHDTADGGVLNDFSRLLRSGYSAWSTSAAPTARIADALDERIERWKLSKGVARRTLLYSGFAELSGEKQGLEKLAELWSQLSVHPPRKLLAVSPFFDRGETKLIDRLAVRLGKPGEIHLVTDAAHLEHLGTCHYGAKGDAEQVRRLSLISADITPDELARVARLNDWGRHDELHISRKLHAKIMILCSGKQHLVYMGSANFTCKAWNGDNQELGLVTVHQGAADQLIALVLQALSAQASDAYHRLADEPTAPPDADDEDEVLPACYPDFIRRIELRQSAEGDALVFHFDTDEPDRLIGYRITWGNLELTVNGHSAALNRTLAQLPLQGGRNLCFALRTSPTQTYWLPFVHSADLVQQRDLLLFDSTEDWLAYHLHPAGPAGYGQAEDERLPGEDKQSEAASGEWEPKRDHNPVIAMQRKLSLFAQVEASFSDRAKQLAATRFAHEKMRHAAIQQRIAEPLRVYAALLKAEYMDQLGMPNSSAVEVYAFGLGEMALLSRHLQTELKAARPLTELILALAKDLRQIQRGQRSANSPLRTYIQFIQTQLAVCSP